MVPLAEPDSPRRKSWLDRGEGEFNQGAGSIFMRETFSGQIIHRQKITEALELTAKGESA